jgi:hypothetical protein
MCAAAACALVAASASSAQAYVYWSSVTPVTAPGATPIGRADQNATGVNDAFVPGPTGGSGIAVDGSHIYWPDDAANAIGRANLNGSDPDPTFIANATSGLDAEPNFVTTDGTYIYWTDGQRYVGRAAIDGTGAQPHFLDVGSNSFPNGIAVSSGTVYVGGFSEIVSFQDSAGSPHSQIITQVNTDFLGLAIVGDTLYFSTVGVSGDGIWSATTSGANMTQLVSATFPDAIATDGTYLYWTANNEYQNDGTIGRGLLTGSGLTMPDPTFISGSGDPAGVAVDGVIDPTNTTVSCQPTAVATGAASTCTATVDDSASSSPPTGIVAFNSSASTFFSGSASSCTLRAQADGGADCTVGAVSIAPGTIPISAAYAGDAVHAASSGSAGFCVGTAAQCGAKPPPAKPACVVPKLKGKTLAQARTALRKGHCALGKVTKPANKRHRHKPPRLVVGSTKPAAGRLLANGAKVAVKLVAAPVKKRKR